MPPKKKEIPPAVVASEFRLVDDKGRLRASLSTWPADGHPRLDLYDDAHLQRLVISLRGNGDPCISLLRVDGSTMLGIGISDLGRAGIAIYRPDGMPALRIQFDEEFNPTIIAIKPHDNDTVIWP